MTEPHVTTEAGHGGVRSEEDRISTPRIVAVGVGSLLLFFLASLASSVYLQTRQGEHGPVPIPPEVGRSKIGLVEQQDFDLAVRGLIEDADNRARSILESHRKELEDGVALLLANETLTVEDFAPLRGQRDREARLERLASFGWVDRSTGVADVPIDVAMDLVAKGVRAEGGSGQEQRNAPGGQP